MTLRVRLRVGQQNRPIGVVGTEGVGSIGRAANGKLDYRTLSATATIMRATRPVEEKSDALNAAVTAGIDAAMNELEDDLELWCGILTGGPSVFERRPPVWQGK